MMNKLIAAVAAASAAAAIVWAAAAPGQAASPAAHRPPACSVLTPTSPPPPPVAPTTDVTLAQAYYCLIDHYFSGATLDDRVLLTGRSPGWSKNSGSSAWTAPTPCCPR